MNRKKLDMLWGKSVFGHHYEFSSAFKNGFFFFLQFAWIGMQKLFNFNCAVVSRSFFFQWMTCPCLCNSSGFFNKVLFLIIIYIYIIIKN